MRFTITILLFILLSIGVLFYSQVVTPKRDQSKGDSLSPQKIEKFSEFNKIDYYISRNGFPYMYLNSEKLNIDETHGKTTFTMPKGRVYSKINFPTFYEAESGEYDTVGSMLQLFGKVEISREGMKLVSEEANYYIKKDKFLANGKVKTTSNNKKNGDRLMVSANTVESWPSKEQANYIGDVKGWIKRKRVYEDSIYFSTDELNVDMVKSYAALNGKVQIKKTGVKAESLRAEIFLENYNKKLKYCVLYDDVRFEQKFKDTKTGNLILRRAFAEKAEVFNMERKSVLTGAPKVYQEDDVIRGNAITLRENTETIEIDDSTSVIEIKD